VTVDGLGSLPEPVKTQENMKKFVKIVIDDVRIRGQLLKLVSPDCECKKAEEAVVSHPIVFCYATIDNLFLPFHSIYDEYRHIAFIALILLVPLQEGPIKPVKTYSSNFQRLSILAFSDHRKLAC